MSREFIRGIKIEDNKVFIRSSTTVGFKSPVTLYENTCLSQIYTEKGKEGVFAKIGEEYWKGNVSIRDVNNKLCIAIVTAIEWLPEDIHKEDFEAEVIGDFIGKAAAQLYKNPYADLSKEADELFAYMKC